MSLRPYRILSIDFDYFQDVTMHTVKNFYPDGVDLPSEVTAVVWSKVYSKHHPGYQEIQDVSVNQELLKQAKSIMLMQRDIPVVMAQSHIHIWNEIEDRCVRGQDLFLTHIDFHDDLTNGNEEHGIVDCGNWIWFATRFYHTKMIWYTRTTSMQCYGIDPHELPVFVDDLTSIMAMRQQYDLIFICRSDPWTPPHLDEEFDKLVDFCECNFTNVYVQNTVRQPRSMEDVLNAAQQIDYCYQQIMSGGGIIKC